MRNNNYYVTPLTIFNRIARVHKNKTINHADVIEWAAECTTEYIEDFDSFVRYSGIKIQKETNGRFYLPTIVYRILDVLDTGSRPIPYHRRAGYIELEDKNVSTILLDYVGIPVDDEGQLCIDKNHSQAVEAFIVHKLYYEDYLIGKIHPNMWSDIVFRMENELVAAKGSFRHWDQRKFETMTAIQHEIAPEIARVPLFKYYNISGL